MFYQKCLPTPFELLFGVFANSSVKNCDVFHIKFKVSYVSLKWEILCVYWYCASDADYNEQPAATNDLQKMTDTDHDVTQHDDIAVAENEVWHVLFVY